MSSQDEMDTSVVEQNKECIEVQSMDPLIKVPDACDKIFGYLSAKELLTVMEVSRRWKKFIESRSKFMNYATDGIIVEPDLTNCSIEVAKSLLRNNDFRRPYKHMKTQARLRKISEDISSCFKPVRHYAETLVTLDLECCDVYYGHDLDSDWGEDGWEYEIKQYTLPKLQKMRCENFGYFSASDWKKYFFPAATHLELTKFKASQHGEVDFMLQQFPKLKCLCLNDEVEPYGQGEVGDQLPKIEQISMMSYSFNFLNHFKDSLKILEIKAKYFIIDMYEVSLILRDLKVLKSLTISGDFYCNGEEQFFLQNSSIEILKIKIVSCDEEDEEQIELSRNAFERMFLALPSLKKLVVVDLLHYYFIDHRLIQFAASSMTNLMEFVGTEIAEGAWQAYREIQSNRHLYGNTSFELIEERNHKFREIYGREFSDVFWN